MLSKTVVWFRNDLRLADHPALWNAAADGEVVLLYIHEPQKGRWCLGGATKWWLHHSLLALENEFKKLNAQLVIREGDPLDQLMAVIEETNATVVFWNRRYEPDEIAIDIKVKSELSNRGIECRSFCGNLLYEPWTILNKSGKPFQVFTPFWKACQASYQPEKPLDSPAKIKSVNCKTLSVKALGLLPKIHWDDKLVPYWTPGEVGAMNRLAQFIRNSICDYALQRDFPHIDGVSLMSPHLHFGEISPRSIWKSVVAKADSTLPGVECYLRQLGWREFAHHLLFHFPKTPDRPLREDFDQFPWKRDPKGLQAWKKGLTGYPIVDAGMRQLWQTGWMHNRVRMIVGSFLVKDLLISWVEGAHWFWDTLVDADLANNTLGWQWVGGCGADAAPYFRVFNPSLQSEKFDSSGDYIRQWVPELNNVSERWIHEPWNAPPMELKLAGVTLGKDYPYPVVDHKKARDEALKAFKAIRSDDDHA